MRTLTGQRLVIATHNRGKLEEIAALLAPYGVRCVAAGDLGLAVPEETEDSFVGNALLKARAAASAAGLPSLADDSGLAVAALGGAPGVRSADWAETAEGRNFDAAMARVWRELEAAGVAEPRRAAFHCVLAVGWPDGPTTVFEGRIDGRIVWPPRGALGFGYDPIFQPDGLAQTFAEMDRWEKNRMSHRGRAFAVLVEACFT
jgi:XTP/dITP diphosphohydrolase